MLVRVLLLLLFVLLVALIYAFCFFIPPRIEASYANAGIRPPAWAIFLFKSSHFLIDYWLVVLPGLAALIWGRSATGYGSPPRRLD